MKKEVRAWQFDEIKFFLIFLVVLGHILANYIGTSNASIDIQRLRFLIYFFHMPLFLFISGLFSKKNIEEKRYSQINYYLVLYLVVKIICFISNAIQKDRYLINFFSESEVAWYCFALFAFQMITILLKNKNKTFIFFSSIILGLLVGYDPTIRDQFVLSRIITFYPFFFAGYVLNPKKIIEKLSSLKIIIPSIIIVITFSLVVFVKINDIMVFSPLLTGRNPYNTLGDYMKVGWALRMVYYALVFLICFAIISIFTILKKPTIFNKFGKRTLSAYALHMVVVDFLFFKTLNPNDWMPNNSGLLLIPIDLIITLVLSMEIFEKPFVWLKKKCIETTEKSIL